MSINGGMFKYIVLDPKKIKITTVNILEDKFSTCGLQTFTVSEILSGVFNVNIIFITIMNVPCNFHCVDTWTDGVKVNVLATV